jgi:hypothetical protein
LVFSCYRYNGPKKPKTTAKKELKKNNKIEMDFIMEGLPDSVKDKVGKCLSTKELWDKLHNLYFSSITELENSKEYACIEQEEICSSCQIDSEEEECEEAEVNYREELLSAIECLWNEKRKNKSLQEELKEKEEYHNTNYKEVKQMIMMLKK